MTRGEIRKLDQAWASLVKRRASYACEYCGSRGWVEASHVCGRRYRFTRWGAYINGRWELNGHCLCHVCHQHYDDHGIREHSVVDRVIGRDRLYILQVASSIPSGNQDYQTISRILSYLEEYGKH